MKKEDNLCFSNPDRISSYFKQELGPLLLLSVTGILYNVGMVTGPWFEGQLAQRLFDIMEGKKNFTDMVVLALAYVLVTLFVQAMRYVKRFYVRRFANDTSRTMKRVLYSSLVRTPKAALDSESVGSLMTKAISDVDACVEGMRKFTTEIFDTGVVLIAYLVMLFAYDWKLAAICCIFPPFAYLIAEGAKKIVYRFTAAFRESAGKLNSATLDRVSGAVTYRVYGCEAIRNSAYEERLSDYEKKAVKASLWETSMQPVYEVISMTSVIFIVWFGGKNVTGSGWQAWDIAAFTTFLSCFTKLAVKSSKAAKLFNSVQKAQVSWKRIKPMLATAGCVVPQGIRDDREPATGCAMPQDARDDREPAAGCIVPLTTAAAGEPAVAAARSTAPAVLRVENLSFSYPGGPKILHDISFTAKPGQVIALTGPVACGKSTLGKAFLCEYPYEGHIYYGDRELSSIPPAERSRILSYMGHAPELMSDTVAENVSLGDDIDIAKYLREVDLDREISEMPQGINTLVGSSGVRLSGGQQARLALARTLCRKRPVMVLDDPFSAVDRKTEIRIFETLKKEAGDSILFLISHRLYLFPQADCVLWMENGSVTAGTHRSMMEANPEYAALYLTQTKGGEEHAFQETAQ